MPIADASTQHTAGISGEAQHVASLHAAAAPMIVCNEKQARSFLKFLAAPVADQLRLIKGSGPASDGRLCELKFLDHVELGSAIDGIDANGHHWVAREATRWELNKKYEFVVVGVSNP